MHFRLIGTNTLILLFSVFLVLPRWIFNHYFYPDVDLLFRILNLIDSNAYLPLVHNLSELNLKPSYDLDKINAHGIFGFPILNLFIVSFFWKIFGSQSFIILEIICVFLFLRIFYSLLKDYFSTKIFIIFSCIFLYSLNFYLDYLTQLDNNLISIFKLNFTSFYNLRIPRPLISNIFLFFFIILCHKIFLKKKENTINYFLLGIISGISLHVFFYFFLIQNIFLFFLIIYKNKKNFTELMIKDTKKIILYFVTILFFLLLYFINLQFIDKDYLTRIGTVQLDLEAKKVLISYFVGFITNKFFIFLLVANITLTFFFKKKIFYFLLFLFFSTILNPLIFILISNKIVDSYHFFNWIIISGSLNLIILLLFLINFFHNNIKKNLSAFLIILTLIIVNINQIAKDNNAFINKDVINKYEIIKYLDKETNAKEEILVLDQAAFVWLVMNNYQNFTYIPKNIWTVRSNSDLLENFINLMKFFNLNSNDFKMLLENKKNNYRMENDVARNFLGKKYIANSLYTYKKSEDFNDIEFIKKIKPTISHSFAIPRFEIERLVKKFNEVNLKIEPKYIIINKQNTFFKVSNINLNYYCNVKDNSTNILFKRKINCN